MHTRSDLRPLSGVRVVSLAANVPGPVAAARFRRLGADVLKVEPPAGDALGLACPRWYGELIRGQRVVSLDLSRPAELDRLLAELTTADLLLTASRPAALERLSLGWTALHDRFPRLCQIAIVGYPAPDQNRAGHDLTYEAEVGLLEPPALPRTLLADLAAAEQAVTAALALLLARERGGPAGYLEVAIASAAASFAEPLRHGLTTPDGPLGGTLPLYRIYAAADGWIAIAALEPRFAERLLAELDLPGASAADLERIFQTRTSADWARWAVERDLPLVAVQRPPAVSP